MRGWLVIVAAAGCYSLNDSDEADAPPAVDARVTVDSPPPIDSTPVADAEIVELTITEVEDTFLHLANPTFNNGASGRWCADVDDARVALLRFNLYSIPEGATVREAVLGVRTGALMNDGAVTTYAVHEMLEPWIEGTLVGAPGQASWNERALGTPWISAGAGPGSRSPDPIASFIPTGTDTEHLVGLDPALVQRWLTAAENRGIAIVSTTNDGACFVSSEGTEPTKRPYLSVSFEMP